MFAFSAGAGSATLTVSGAARSATLDATPTLRDVAGNSLATLHPVDALNASATVMLPAGLKPRQA